MENAKRDPWDRMKDEPMKGFTRFTKYYLPLGPGRSLLAAFHEYAKEKGLQRRRAAPNEWRAQFKQWNWEERAAKFDEWELSKYRQQVVYELRKARERHMQYGRLLQSKSLAGLKEIDPQELNAEMLLRLLEKGVTIELAALGEPEEVKKNREEGSPTGAPQLIYYIPNNGRDTKSSGEAPNPGSEGSDAGAVDLPPPTDAEPPAVDLS